MGVLPYRFGFWAALAAFAATAGYCVAQLLQIAGLLTWPWDEVLIYATSLGIAWPFMLAILALHHATANEQRFWSAAGMLFAVIYAAYVGLVYPLQLGVAIPLRLDGVPEKSLAMTRYSLSWMLDAMGYINMGLATLFCVGAFPPTDKWIRRFFLAHGLMTGPIAFVYFYPSFSTRLLLLGAPWMITALGSLFLLALWFSRHLRSGRMQ